MSGVRLGFKTLILNFLLDWSEERVPTDRIQSARVSNPIIETQSISINNCGPSWQLYSWSVNPSLYVELSILAIADESEMLTVSVVLVLMRVKSSHIWTSSHYPVKLNVGINVSCQRKHWILFSNICQNKTSASASRILITDFLVTFPFCLFLWKIPSLELALIECKEC